MMWARTLRGEGATIYRIARLRRLLDIRAEERCCAVESLMLERAMFHSVLAQKFDTQIQENSLRF